jgi:branched-chain amino acid transport system substrate-binding protein
MRHLILAIALCLSLAGPATASAPAPYPIDVILPITGPGAFVGTTQQKSLIALEALVNKDGGIRGRPVSFVFHDDGTSPQLALQLSTQLIANKSIVVLGSSLGPMCKAIQPAFSSGTVNYCLSPVITPEPTGFVFSASVSGRDFVRASIRYFRLRGWKRIASLNTTDASGAIADGDIAAALKEPENHDVTLVDAEHFNPTDTSVTAQVAKIKSANPQAIIVWTPGTPFGTALHGLQDVGLDVPVMTSSANMVIGQLKSYADIVPKDLFFQGVPFIEGVPQDRPSAQLEAFRAAIKAAGMQQDFQSGIAWDPAMIVVDALRKLGPDATAAQLHAYLENLHGYVGISGTYDFRGGNQRGLTLDDVVITRWDEATGGITTVAMHGGVPLK